MDSSHILKMKVSVHRRSHKIQIHTDPMKYELFKGRSGRENIRIKVYEICNSNPTFKDEPDHTSILIWQM